MSRCGRREWRGWSSCSRTRKGRSTAMQPGSSYCTPSLTLRSVSTGHETSGRDAMGETRGHYKIFLGMAAGVGKTYRMLQEARAVAEAGRDVVIGYLEPHDRPETIALADGLDTAPRRRVPYRDAVT